jgi:hypothetical protein
MKAVKQLAEATKHAQLALSVEGEGSGAGGRE